MGLTITAAMHVLHPIGNSIGVECTACGHKTRKHHEVEFGLWKCDDCGRKCKSIFIPW